MSQLRKGKILSCLVAIIVISSLVVVSPARVQASPSGTYFDHIVIIAMENTPYDAVFGSGTASTCPASSAPFLCSMLPVSSTIPSMNNYGATAADSNDFNGCSAACYVGLMLGNTYGVSDGYSFGNLSGNPQFVNSLSSAGLTWQAYCESGCPRGADHFPFSGSNTFRSSSVSPTNLIAAANSANPPNFLWFTPTDGDNMHDVSVSTGDSYLRSFLVGSGSITSPTSGSLLASNLFTNSNYRTLLYLWWDECGGSNGSCDGNNDAPNLFYGSTVKRGYVSADSNGIDEYASIWTIESNWGFSPLAQGDTAAENSGYQFNDIFTGGSNGGSSTITSSLTYSPSSSIPVNATINFSASAQGGTGPYTYSWNFGDGSTAAGQTTSHSYDSSGIYAVTMTATDSMGKTTTKTQQVTVGQASPIFGTISTFLFAVIGMIVAGMAGSILFLGRYHSQNRRLQDEIAGSTFSNTSERRVRSKRSGQRQQLRYSDDE